MQARAPYVRRYQWVLFYAAMLLGVAQKGWTAVLNSEVVGSQTTQYLSQGADNQQLSLPNNQRPQIYLAATSRIAPLELRKPIEHIPSRPHMRVDACAAQHASYVPWIQAIDIAYDYGSLVVTLFTQEVYHYVGRLHILFRYNIQLLGIWGHQTYTQSKILGNQSGCTSSGHYGGVGLAYFIPYNQRNNLYTGIHYGRSMFVNRTKPALATDASVRQTLSASWWELVLGSEHQLFSNLGFYAGLVIHLKSCCRCDSFAPATNYVIPGYGRSVQRVVPALTLYIAYKISFLKKHYF